MSKYLKHSVFFRARWIGLTAVLLLFLYTPAAKAAETENVSASSTKAANTSETAMNASAEAQNRSAAAKDRFVQAFADTSVQLLKQTAALSGKNDNILISPDSIVTLLVLAQNGTAGSTRSQMEKALGGISTKKYTRSLLAMHKRLSGSEVVAYQSANSVWYKKKAIQMKKAFLNKARKSFGADVYGAPFNSETLRRINSWVSDKTNGKITQILDRLSPSARVCLLNAVYFKGNWEDPYHNTVKRRFTSASGKKQKVPMLEGTEHAYVTAAGGEGFIKTYQGGRFAFMALLPPKGTSVKQYVKKLKGSTLLNAYAKRQTKSITVHTRMPEFQYEYMLSLKKPLMKMGLSSIFSTSANFSNMTASPVCVDDVLHKTYIKLDKDGTEAAAVTAMIVKATAFFDPHRIEKTVYLNRPFVYAILDTETGLPLFLGILSQVS